MYVNDKNTLLYISYLRCYGRTPSVVLHVHMNWCVITDVHVNWRWSRPALHGFPLQKSECWWWWRSTTNQILLTGVYWQKHTKSLCQHLLHRKTEDRKRSWESKFRNITVADWQVKEQEQVLSAQYSVITPADTSCHFDRFELTGLKLSHTQIQYRRRDSERSGNMSHSPHVHKQKWENNCLENYLIVKEKSSRHQWLTISDLDFVLILRVGPGWTAGPEYLKP